MLTPEIIENAAAAMRSAAESAMEGWAPGCGSPESYRANLSAAEVLDAIARAWRAAQQQSGGACQPSSTT